MRAAEGLILASAVLVLGALAFYPVRRTGRVSSPLVHFTSPEIARVVTANAPPGWVDLRPSTGWRLPLLGWPLHPFAERICFFGGWPSRWAQRYNLEDRDKPAVAVLIEVEDLKASMAGRLYRRPIDGSVAWTGVYRGPARLLPAVPSHSP